MRRNASRGGSRGFVEDEPFGEGGSARDEDDGGGRKVDPEEEPDDDFWGIIIAEEEVEGSGGITSGEGLGWEEELAKGEAWPKNPPRSIAFVLGAEATRRRKRDVEEPELMEGDGEVVAEEGNSEVVGVAEEEGEATGVGRGLV